MRARAGRIFVRSVVTGCGLLIALAAFAPRAPAQDYPTRPMTVIGTTPAGTSVDLATRFFGERIKAATGQPWVVENKPGAGGAIAGKAAASARPDGYTMIVGSSGSQAADKFLFKDLAYDPVKDFVPVAATVARRQPGNGSRVVRMPIVLTIV
jgi:tripartite-type tricarboxylate transporter receptor subunit TctC